jgi:hypothetical protein
VSQYGRLICLSGPDMGKEYELKGQQITIGRSSSQDIVLNDPYASRQHAEIHLVDNAYRLHDLGSKNGVFVSGRRLGEGATAWLEDGEEIQLASTRYRFQDPSVTITAPSLIAVQEPSLRVDPTTRQVYVDGSLLDPPLSVKQFELLWYLYQHRGRVVSKDELATNVWPEVEGEVYDANIDRMVSRVRSRIEPDEREDPRFIVTIRGYGYQMKNE